VTERPSRLGLSRFSRRASAQPLNDAVIRVYDESGNVIETHEHKSEFKEP